jgi:threonine-phosphate decarboxylase
MMIRGHGGNIYELAERIGCRTADIVDMSSNMNPLGPPEGLIDFLRENLEKIDRLPEVDAFTAVKAFAGGWGIEPKNVLAGNGTTQFIYSLPLALQPRGVLIVGPVYSDYADACAMHGTPFDFYLCREDRAFQPDFSEIGRKKGFDTVFFCNPNNPTGVLTPRQDLIAFIRAFPKTRFIVDESYLPFVDRWEKESLIPERLPNVIVLYSMSKFFRIPGLRIGFLIAPDSLMHLQLRYALPWSVNSLSQLAVEYLAARTDEIEAFVERSRSYLAAQRSFLLDRFGSSPFIRFYPSATSYLLGRVNGKHTAESLFDFLCRRKILIRNCSNFIGLSNRFIRISLKSKDVNERLVECLMEAFATGASESESSGGV